MKISVVIPIYNEEKYIKNCLQAIANQSLKPDEVIVVNNNSTDKSLLIIKSFYNKLPLIIINEKKQGTIFARNKGFNIASGDIIVRTDADTQHKSDWLSRIKKNFTENKIDALTGPVVFYDLPLSYPFWAKTLIYIFKIITGYFPLFGPGMALTKKAWRKIKNDVCLDEKKVHEDMDLSIHLNKFHLIIGYDSSFISYASGRRIKDNPLSFFIEYPIRLIKMLITHSR